MYHIEGVTPWQTFFPGKYNVKTCLDALCLFPGWGYVRNEI